MKLRAGTGGGVTVGVSSMTFSCCCIRSNDLCFCLIIDSDCAPFSAGRSEEFTLVRSVSMILNNGFPSDVSKMGGGDVGIGGDGSSLFDGDESSIDCDGGGGNGVAKSFSSD